MNITKNLVSASNSKSVKWTMLKINFFIVLLSIDAVASLDGRPRIPQRNPLELKLIEKNIKENPGLVKIDPTLFQDDNNKKIFGRSLISKHIFASIIEQITKMSNFPTLVATNISEKCHNDSQAYYDAKLLLANWANQMFESTGRLPEGLFSSGNLHAKGLFDQCINVQAKWLSTSFAGKYCTIFFDSAPVMPEELVDQVEEPNNESIFFEKLDWLFNGPTLKKPKVRDTDLKTKFLTNVDFCIPSSCSMKDFRNAVAQLIGSRAIETTTLEGNRSFISMVAKTDEKLCYTKDKINATPQFNGADIVVMFVLGLLGFVTLMATLHEFLNIYNNRPVQTENDGFCLKALHCFSMLTNCRYLLSTKTATVENLGCLNGIRVLSTAWIVLFHTYYLLSTGHFTTYNGFMFHQDALTWQIHGLLNGTLAVDTFFFMSGLLVAYSLLRELDQNKGQFNIGLFYLHRYLRLTPVYAFILGFIATLLAYCGSGPYWQTMGDWITACQWNWWNNLLYINNYVFTYPQTCMGETWYLACDMQMFLLSPLFIYLLWKRWKVGIAFSMFTIVASLSGTIFIFIIWDLPPLRLFTRIEDDKELHRFFGYYIQTWTRCPPYILGIIMGWVLHRVRKTSIRISKFVVTIGWLLAIVNILAICYGLVPYLDEVKVPKINDFVRVSYGVLHHFAWAVSLAWIVFACIHGYGGFINRFLSWKPFIPLSRLTYVVYLIHLNYLILWHALNRKPYYYTRFTHTEHIFGATFMVSLMAFAICLVIEMPLLNLEKLFLPARSRKSQGSDTENQRNKP